MIREIATTEPAVLQDIINEVRENKGHIENCYSTCLWIQKEQLWYEYYTPNGDCERIVINESEDTYSDDELIQCIIEQVNDASYEGCQLLAIT